MNIVKRLMTPLMLLPGLVLASNVHADEWEVDVAPYLWAAGMSGKAATLPGAPPAELDVEFDDLFDDLEIGLMGSISARKDRAGMNVELVYLSLDTDEADSPGPFYSGVQYEAEIMVLTVLGTYRYDLGESQVELLAGARYWDADNELDLEPGLAAGTSLDQAEDWLDWMVGARSVIPLSDNWGFRLSGLVAIAGDSDRQLDVLAGFQYALSKTSELVISYRYLEVDYDTSDFLYDVEIEGPLIGAVFRL
jgi:hypothetical protein